MLLFTNYYYLIVVLVQEVLSRIKAHPDFCKDPYGNPFDSEEVSTQYNVAILAVTTGEDDIEEAVYEEQESEEEFNPVGCLT